MRFDLLEGVYMPNALYVRSTRVGHLINTPHKITISVLLYLADLCVGSVFHIDSIQIW